MACQPVWATALCFLFSFELLLIKKYRFELLKQLEYMCRRIVQKRYRIELKLRLWKWLHFFQILPKQKTPFINWTKWKIITLSRLWHHYWMNWKLEMLRPPEWVYFMPFLFLIEDAIYHLFLHSWMFLLSSECIKVVILDVFQMLVLDQLSYWYFSWLVLFWFSFIYSIFFFVNVLKTRMLREPEKWEV